MFINRLLITININNNFIYYYHLKMELVVLKSFVKNNFKQNEKSTYFKLQMVYKLWLVLETVRKTHLNYFYKYFLF